jgi:hypothetical protein
MGYPRRLRLDLILRWPLGVLMALWRHVTSTMPVHYVEDRDPRDAPGLPASCAAGLQCPDDGVGPLFHRRYSVRIRDSAMSPREMMMHLTRGLNLVMPCEVTLLEPQSRPHGLRVGDDLVVRMPGPWEGPVRIVDLTPTSFRLATRQRHMEAGQIELRAAANGGDLLFEIESWARSASRTSHFLYDRLGIARHMQSYVWSQCCRRAWRLSGGRLVHGVDIYTGRGGEERR